MKKLVSYKCPNCGSNLKIEKGIERINCKYCGTDFVIEDDVDYNLKKAVNSSFKSGRKIATGILIVWFIIVFAIVSIFVYIIFSALNQDKPYNGFEIGFIEREKATTFNFFLEDESGTQNSFFVKGLIDKIVTSNKKNKNHLIKVIFKDISTTDPNKIKDIKKELNKSEYEISFDYDKYGYINIMTIEEVESN